MAMATKKAKKKASNKATSDDTEKRTAGGTKPKFPYTTKPSSLRRFLKDVPGKPKPSKFDRDLLRAWGFGDSNDYTMLRVLKAIGLLNDRNEPTDTYAQFMLLDGGAKAIAPSIRSVYEPLFQASLEPYKESNEMLKNLFNIHSGGGDKALDQQIQTFKVLCENASFEGGPAAAVAGTVGAVTTPAGTVGAAPVGTGSAPIVNINLHIHLPENKSRRDYEDMIEDIGRYIFGRQNSRDDR